MKSFQAALAIFIMAQAGAAFAQSHPIPAPVVTSICNKYEGKAAFVSKGAETRITCSWVKTLASNWSEKSLTTSFRGVLQKARTLEGLRTSGAKPSDLDCGDYSIVTVDGEARLDCSSQLGVTVPVTFYADAQGNLKRVRIDFQYKELYRVALTKSVARGTISSFADAYVDLQSDIFIEAARKDLHSGDSLKLDGNDANLTVEADGL